MAKEFPTKLSAIEKLSRIFDRYANAANVLQAAHNQIHEGNQYGVEVTDSLASAAAIEVFFTTPAAGAGYPAHFVWEAFAAASAYVQLIEGVTYTSGGVDATPVNNNRLSSNTSDFTAVKVGSPAGTPLVYSGGTTIHGPAYFAAGRNSAGDSRQNEFVLKFNTSYVMRVVSGAAANRCWLEAQWYEHPNSDLQAVS